MSENAYTVTPVYAPDELEELNIDIACVSAEWIPGKPLGSVLAGKTWFDVCALLTNHPDARDERYYRRFLFLPDTKDAVQLQANAYLLELTVRYDLFINSYIQIVNHVVMRVNNPSILTNSDTSFDYCTWLKLPGYMPIDMGFFVFPAKHLSRVLRFKWLECLYSDNEHYHIVSIVTKQGRLVPGETKMIEAVINNDHMHFTPDWRDCRQFNLGPYYMNDSDKRNYRTGWSVTGIDRLEVFKPKKPGYAYPCRWQVRYYDPIKNTNDLKEFFYKYKDLDDMKKQCAAAKAFIAITQKPKPGAPSGVPKPERKDCSEIDMSTEYDDNCKWVME